MYLKNLTALGFKSFADKTCVNFQKGMTAIVGPNGCGKSNVADAIRWVLGEQSAKALRGGEMADVIFNGTDTRKPLGMAEVSLTIGGIDEENLKAAGVEMHYHEVTLTRRVFRDGGSEYYINKTACRLKDIQRLFMGTGVGRTSYSIMAQGNITQILSSKPEERRLVFEEAAGITKFKAQKREALRKLEHTEQNLLRVDDLIREVKRQIGSLQRQAGKARRYKKIISELQHLECQLARHKFDLLQTDIARLKESEEETRRRIAELSEKVIQGEDQIDQLRQQVSALDHDMGEAQRKGLELKGESDQHEHRIQFNEQRLYELEHQNSKALNDVSACEERRLTANQELKEITEQLQEMEGQVARHRGQVEEKRGRVHEIEKNLIQRQSELRQLQTETFSVSQQLSRSRNEINALDLQKQGNVVRLEKLSTEKIQLEEERSGLQAKLKDFASQVENERECAASHRGTVEERQARLKTLQTQIAECVQALDELMREQSKQRSRLDVLEQLVADHEGFSSTALNVLKEAEGVHGFLADRIRVPNEYIAAIEVALSHHLQMALAQSPRQVITVLEDLKANRKGRASIAALELGESLPDESPVDCPSGRDPMEVIAAEDSVKKLLRRLLFRTRIVADLNEAVAAWNQCGGAFEFVTQSGDFLDRAGVATGGFSKEDANGPSSILGRKNQIEELKTQIDALEERINVKSREKGGLQSEQTSLQASLQEAQSELRDQEVAIATREGEFRALENSLKVLGQKVETVVYEIQSLSSQDQEGRQKREDLASQIRRLEEQERESIEKTEGLGQTIEEINVQREEANSELTDAKVTLAADEQVFESFRKQKNPLELRIRELEATVEQRRKESAEILQRQADAEKQINESKHRVEALKEERDRAQTHYLELKEQKENRDAELKGSEERLRSERQQLNTSQDEKGRMEVQLAQKNMSLENLCEHIREKYHVELDEVRGECITITYTDEGGAPRVESVSVEDMQAQGLSTNWEEVENQVRFLQDKLEKIGPVNLVAIEEYEETEERFQFLTEQHTDLVKAKEQLLEVIQRINTQTREMFCETFEKIRQNFQSLFTEIFGGGKADLVLMEDGDVLESGIDIKARPPGKQLQSISLLSGGEQTMTAVALLFSIYQVKPSPFCVLDELDAPLDESNINRFISVLKRFLERSQFIVITHNKRTIGTADILYGVTMEEHGVSKVVGVRFHHIDEDDGGARSDSTDHQLEAGDSTDTDHEGLGFEENAENETEGGGEVEAKERDVVMAD